jgi:hypothetical protein
MSEINKKNDITPLQVECIQLCNKASRELKELEYLCKENGSENLAKNIARMVEFLRLNLRCELGLKKKNFDNESK